MGKLDVKMMRYLSKEDYRVLTSIEMGMKNHEYVTASLAAQIANLHHGGVHKILKELCKHRLLSYECTKHYEGYRLTNAGYDYLALKTLAVRDLIDCFGNQIGVGKESNIYVVSKNNETFYCLKLHRLGRICFRNVKAKRDYHQHRKYMSWLYLSRISATKEFSYMKALYDRGFPVPKPIDFNRHCIIMELVDGIPLCNIHDVKHVERLYDDLMNIICRLAYCGVVHGDFNEFNIMLTPEEKPIIIDFPQMIPTDHEEAELHFERDVTCIREFFRRRFAFESTMYPIFKNVVTESKEDKKLSKVILHSPPVSDDEDYQFDDEDENVNDLQEKVSKLEVEQEVPQLISSIEVNSESSDIDNDCQKQSSKLEPSLNESVSENTESNNLDNNCENTETNDTYTNCDKEVSNVDDNTLSLQPCETNSCFDGSETCDMMSTTSTYIPGILVTKRVRSELVKRDKRMHNKRVLKKCSKATKSRRENYDIAKENPGIWDD